MWFPYLAWYFISQVQFLCPQATIIRWLQPDLVRMAVVSIGEHSQLRDLLTQFLNTDVLRIWFYSTGLLRTSWWFTPIWKICSSKLESSPNRHENKKCLKPPPREGLEKKKRNHQPNMGWYCTGWSMFIGVFLVGYSTFAAFWKAWKMNSSHRLRYIQLSGLAQHFHHYTPKV